MFGWTKRGKHINPFFGIATTGRGGLTPRGEQEPDSLVRLRSDFEKLQRTYHIDVTLLRDKVNLLSRHLGVRFKMAESIPEHLELIRDPKGVKKL
jgi:hypothetical protein